MFEQAPSLKEKFKFFKEAPEISDDNVHLRKHALTVMETVNVAVGKLEEGALKDLSEDLVDVGAAHHVHNISQKDFEVRSSRTACQMLQLDSSVALYSS